jgi:SAM-dependent methyltransferase
MRPPDCCQACGAAALDPFYSVRGIPVHSVLLMSTRKRALDYPRGDLELVFCSHCGFIQNTRFDPNVHEYSTQYEETQGFSPTFRRFADGLVRRWIERFDLRNRRVLEIGCGKGEFLVTLCELGPNEGVGFDPAWVEQRVAGSGADRIRFVPEFFTSDHDDIDADFVCCRHTLEHIQPVLEFMSSIRTALGDRLETAVCFELPDVHRILKEGAFWDIYYEHCSYFSCGTLARLFQRAGFDVLDVDKDFGSQYILLEARPAGGEPRPLPPAAESVDALADEVRTARDTLVRSIERWRERFAGFQRDGQRVAIWGSGSKAVSFLTTLGISPEACWVTDVNPYRHGTYLPGAGHEIIPPADLAAHKPDVVVVMNPMYVEEIRGDLQAMGLDSQIIACA